MIFIADLIACSTCFGHHYAHHQELESIIQVVAACRTWCFGFQVVGMVWIWGLCVRFANRTHNHQLVCRSETCTRNGHRHRVTYNETVWNELDYRVDVCRITKRCIYRAPVRYVTKTWSVVLLNKKIHILLSQVYCVWQVVKPRQSFSITLY